MDHFETLPRHFWNYLSDTACYSLKISNFLIYLWFLIFSIWIIILVINYQILLYFRRFCNRSIYLRYILKIYRFYFKMLIQVVITMEILIMYWEYKSTGTRHQLTPTYMSLLIKEMCKEIKNKFREINYNSSLVQRESSNNRENWENC